jgi:predicted nucleotidyltransferase/uncharacterized protein (UPF0332 family)
MVEISFQYKKKPVEYHHDQADVEITTKFSLELKKELTNLLKGVILFGSAARGTKQPESDLDILLILDDLSIVLSKEVMTGLRVIIENTAAKVSNNFHITTMHLSDFWSYVRSADPVVINILREGYPVYDEGFFLPVQTLLFQGKIRPTKEAVWAYYMRAPQTIRSAEKKFLSIIVDCYWAVIDAAHAALMHIDVVPGAPHHVSELLEKHFVRKRLLAKNYLHTLNKLYKLAKEVNHEKLATISGKEVDGLIEESKEFVKQMKFLLSHEPQKLQ